MAEESLERLKLWQANFVGDYVKGQFCQQGGQLEFSRETLQQLCQHKLWVHLEPRALVGATSESTASCFGKDGLEAAMVDHAQANIQATVDALESAWWYNCQGLSTEALFVNVTSLKGKRCEVPLHLLHFHQVGDAVYNSEMKYPGIDIKDVSGIKYRSELSHLQVISPIVSLLSLSHALSQKYKSISEAPLWMVRLYFVFDMLSNVVPSAICTACLPAAHRLYWFLSVAALNFGISFSVDALRSWREFMKHLLAAFAFVVVSPLTALWNEDKENKKVNTLIQARLVLCREASCVLYIVGGWCIYAADGEHIERLGFDQDFLKILVFASLFHVFAAVLLWCIDTLVRNCCASRLKMEDSCVYALLSVSVSANMLGAGILFLSDDRPSASSPSLLMLRATYIIHWIVLWISKGFIQAEDPHFSFLIGGWCRCLWKCLLPTAVVIVYTCHSGRPLWIPYDEIKSVIFLWFLAWCAARAPTILGGSLLATAVATQVLLVVLAMCISSLTFLLLSSFPLWCYCVAQAWKSSRRLEAAEANTLELAHLHNVESQ